MTKRCKILLGVTLAGLEEEINSAMAEDPSSRLVQAFFAHGTGFVAAMEYEGQEKQESASGKQSAKKARPPGRQPK